MKKIELHEMVGRLMERFEDNSLNAILDFKPPTEDVERVEWLALGFRDGTLSCEEHFEFQGAMCFIT